MAVTATNLSSRLRLVVQTGTDAQGNPLTDTISYSRVKPNALDQDVYDVAQILGSLQVYPVQAVRRVTESELTQSTV